MKQVVEENIYCCANKIYVHHTAGSEEASDTETESVEDLGSFLDDAIRRKREELKTYRTGGASACYDRFMNYHMYGLWAQNPELFASTGREDRRRGMLFGRT